ncbi:hypothetical protein H6P81_007092 [Aristolochia fimbriata]|uniref:Uncharacterized protein n=1 Tax=Aristolochia fimbriata TaxID=158543 RepID=A0AAV7F3P4_ARIFI|nr:hypothetical protein H6P81_007092 [Aristolochia fimbriata]
MKAPLSEETEAERNDIRKQFICDEVQSLLYQWVMVMMTNALKMTLRHDDTSGAFTPNIATISEYMVVFYDSEDPYVQGKSSYANGHANGFVVHDIHNPCRAKVAVREKLHTPFADHSCIHLEFDFSGTGLKEHE